MGGETAAARRSVALSGGLYRCLMPESAAPTIRRGTPADIRACHDLLWISATDLGRRQGTPLEGDADAWWEGIESVHRFLADHAAEWWVAEDGDELIGYARSIDRDGLFELTELFVRPGHQSSGVGRQLLEQAFPLGRGDVRSIIATTDVRATARYYAADTVARFPYFTLTGRPRADAKPDDVSAEAAGTDPAALAAISEIERAVLDFPRGTDELRWLAETRPGYVFVRGGMPIGFAFLTKGASGTDRRARRSGYPRDPRTCRGARRDCGLRSARARGPRHQCHGDPPSARARLPHRSVDEPVDVEPAIRPIRPVHRLQPTDLPVTTGPASLRGQGFRHRECRRRTV